MEIVLMETLKMRKIPFLLPGTAFKMYRYIIIPIFLSTLRLKHNKYAKF